MAGLAAWVLAVVLAGAIVYCLLVLEAARRYLSQTRPEPETLPPLSILRPLMGADLGLAENLRSFFVQDYPHFEILFAMRFTTDPALRIVHLLQQEFPDVPTRVIFTGDPPWTNAKVYSLHCMMQEASADILVMADSDVRADPGLLRRLAAELEDPGIGVVTCPYRAIGGPSLWSRLEAIGMNTEFLAGVLVARMIEGMRFALGPTIAARRSAIQAVGGWEYLKDFLAEDFVLGRMASQRGLGVVLSSAIIEHRIGSQALAANFRHRLRWHRSTRASRPVGYVGQLFTHPLPLSLLLVLIRPEWWFFSLVAIAARLLAAWATAGWILRDPLCQGQWWLLPLQDLLSFGFWIAGFFGRTILWRGHRYWVDRDGRFYRLPEPSP